VLTNKNVLPPASRDVSLPSRARIVLAALVAGGAFACFTAPARAQGYYAPAADSPPTFMTLDRADSATRIGFQTGFTKADEGFLTGTDAIGFRLNLFGQVVLPQRNIGLYGQLALSQIYVEGENGDGFSNLEVGGYLLVGGRNDVILRFGAVLPTASESAEGVITNVTTAFERFTDFTMALPNFTVLRLSLSTLQQSGAAFFRADVGADLAIDTPEGDQDSAFGRVNLAVGLRASAVDLLLELVNLANLDGDYDVEERFVHTAAFGLRTRGQNQLHLGMVFPLDEELRGDLWIVSLGFQHAI
jgi:hypothetical protein